MRDKTQNITFLTVLVFVVCYFARVFHMPNELTVVLGGMICLALLMQQKKIRIDLGLCLLVITLVSYYVISNGIRGVFYAILYIPLEIYIIGKYMVCGIKDFQKYEQRFFSLIMAMVAGYTILGVLNSYMFFAGYVVPGTRRWQDFWSHGIVPGTQHTAYFLPALSMFIPAVMYFKERKVLNIIFIALSVFFCYTALVTKSRMQLVIFVIVCFVQVLLLTFMEKEKTKKVLSNKLTWGMTALVIAICAVVIFMVRDTEVMVAFVNNMGKGGGILNNVRFESQRMALTQLFEFPMGGHKMELGRTYCHNTWLDMANAAGLIPFFAYTAYTVYTVIILLKYLCLKNISTENKIIIGGLYMSFFLYMTVESVFDASIHLLTPWIFLNGVVCGVVSQKIHNI